MKGVLGGMVAEAPCRKGQWPSAGLGAVLGEPPNLFGGGQSLETASGSLAQENTCTRMHVHRMCMACTFPYTCRETIMVMIMIMIMTSGS